jgi:hypothetical protein
MLIKQRYAGWVGIKMNGWCANKDVSFKITSCAMDHQLMEMNEGQVSNALYAEMLIKGIKQQDDFPQKQNMIKYLEGIINQSSDQKVASIKMDKFKNGGDR